MSDVERVARAIWAGLDFASTYDKDLETAKNEPGIAANRILVVQRFAALVLGEPAPAWQPIETAPKDGRIIVAIRNEVGRSLPSFIMWDDIGGWGGMTADDERRVLKFWPTHWMPLPDAPAALEKKEAD